MDNKNRNEMIIYLQNTIIQNVKLTNNYEILNMVNAILKDYLNKAAGLKRL